MNESQPSTYRPFVFTVIEDDGVNVTIEVSEEDYLADLAAGIGSGYHETWALQDETRRFHKTTPGVEVIRSEEASLTLSRMSSDL